MALNLSTLTSPATSGNILEEVTTTADFLENVPVFRNLSRGSNKGGDAKQSVSLNQPRALPLIKNPQGNLGGYLYIPNVSGNYATGPSVTIGSNQTWQGELDMVVTQFGNYIVPMGGGFWSSGFGLIFENTSGGVLVLSKAGPGLGPQPSGVTLGTPFNVKYGYDGTDVYVDIDGVRKFSTTAPSQAAILTQTIQLNQQNNLPALGNYAIQKAKLTVNNAVVFDCDFNGSTSIRHGDTKFQAAVGGVVSIASPQLIPNGNFDTDTAWTKTGGWSIADGVATLASVSGSSDLGSAVIPVTSGKTYKIVVNVIATSGSFRLYDTAGGVVAYSLNVGENVFSRVATGSTYQVVPLSLGNGTATIDSISVTEVSPDAKRDPITVIKKSVLRFDGANDFMNGLLNQTVTGGYMFAAFSVLGDGGESFARVLSVNPTGVYDSHVNSAILSIREGVSDLSSFMGASAFQLSHSGLFDDANGDILHETKITNGNQRSLVNNANLQTQTLGQSILSQEFNLAAGPDGNNNAAIDLEYLALFPASITDAQADSVRNYINNRNNVFSLIDSQGYYFYNSQKAPVGAISSGSSAWNGRIVGSDNGDADKLATQATANDQPVSDGFKVTFADNSDHLDIPQVTLAAGDSYAWMVCGTSLGTFAYKLTVSSQTELSLLGHLGYTGYRKAGDLYGIILLPESATGADIEAARKLLIDRGAADGTTAGSIRTDWYNRDDIVEFKHLNTSSVTASDYAWYSCQALEKFPALDLSNSSTLNNAFFGCTALSDFGAIQADSCGDFTAAWQGTTALTSFPAGAKLGTEANNVNFTAAWQQSGLTSFPSNIDLSKGATFSNTWRSTNLSSYSTPIVLGTNLNQAFYLCGQLTDFSSNVFENWNPASLTSGVFHNTWKFCVKLTAQSVENILTSIDASGKYGTATGAAGGGAIDSGIDIDYNVATGSLSAATNTAVTSLKAKGWSIIVNNVTL